MSLARRSVPGRVVVCGAWLWLAHVAVGACAKDPWLQGPLPLAWSGGSRVLSRSDSFWLAQPVGYRQFPEKERSCTGAAQVELWAVSTRHLSPAGCAASDLAGLGCFRHDGQSWQPTPCQALAESWHRPARTCLYIHGNNSSFESACAHGVALAAAWQRLSPHASTVRLVIWCWPSDRLPVDRPTNARIKADWAEQQGFHVARFLAQLPPRPGVCLWGHSYGARVSTAALHLLGGGTLDGQTSLGGPARPGGRLRTVLTGAAVEDRWLLPGERHGGATRASEKILVVYNPCDPVLWLFPLLPEGGGGPAALGLTGLPEHPRRCEVAPYVEQLDVSGTLGLGHVSQRYLECPEVIRQIKAFLLHDPVASCSREHATTGGPTR